MKLLKHIWLHCCLILLSIWEQTDGVIHSGTHSKKYNNLDSDFTIHKVSLTQKGYIQFLRYISEVPTITDYTFCIWVRSHNLTFSHPLLSYSKHEEERLLRVWISPYGTDINLEILEYPIFKVPINIVENHWYHVCQSWSSHQGAWNLYLNGKLKASGIVPKLKGVLIKEGGDIVVGQEYTDFDKGLDDGIEGDIFGFNFVLSPTSVSLKHPSNPSKHSSFSLRRQFQPTKIKPNLYLTKPLNIHHPYAISPKLHFEEQKLPLIHRKEHFLDSFNDQSEQEVPTVLSYFNVPPNREPKGFLEVGRNIFNNLFGIYEPKTQQYSSRYNSEFNQVRGSEKVLVFPNQLREKNPYMASRTNDIHEIYSKPLGLKLVELSFNCALGKGAPVSGKEVLISWTKTPVRVFGGAILKNIPPFCI